MHKSGIKVLGGLVVVGLMLGMTQTTSAVPPEWANGRAAVEKLGRQLPAVAAANALTPAELRSHLLTDPSLFVDQDDQLLYVEPARPVTADPAAPAATTAVPGDVFGLHSAPDARRVIYLDFNGHNLSGTAWNNSTSRRSCYTDAYSRDTDKATFSATDQAEIFGIWQRVSEDYAPFDIDVTTAEPATAEITRTDGLDVDYGTRVVITNSTTKCANRKTLYQSVCTSGCGGVAYVGVFDQTLNHAYYQPALVFQNGVGSGQKTVAEAISHEAGHNLGLSHDGSASTGYYQGHGSWAPIMGVGYYKAITQWSLGEYAGANNKQDDFVVMTQNGAPPVLDESGAQPLDALGRSGVISSRTDTDTFSFTVLAGTSATLTAAPATTSPDLDIALTVAGPNGTTVVDLPSGSTGSDTSTGMDASITVTAPGDYVLTVDGAGTADPLTSGYSDYASVGRYTVQLTVS